MTRKRTRAEMDRWERYQVTSPTVLAVFTDKDEAVRWIALQKRLAKERNRPQEKWVLKDLVTKKREKE